MTIDPAELESRAARAAAALQIGTSHLVVLISGEGVVEWASPSVTRILGYSQMEMIGRNVLDLIHPDEVGMAASLVDANAANPSDDLLGRDDIDAGNEWRIRHRDGHWVTLETRGNNFLANPDIQGLVVVGLDRTARREYEDALRALASSSVDERGYLELLDLLDAQLTGTASALYLAGRFPGWIQHRVAAELCPPAGVGPWLAAIESGENLIVEDFAAAVTAELMSEELAYVAQRAGYHSCWCIVVPTPRTDLPELPTREILGCLVIWSAAHVRPLLGDEHTIARVAALADLALGRRLSELELRWAAAHDDLTGLLNRSGLMRAIRDFGKPGAFLLVDFDGFKDVNDTHGHAIGDATLQALTERLRTAVRGDDLVGRLGGDEFVVFLPEATVRSATAAADRLVEIFLQPITVGEIEMTLSVSIGIDCSQNISMDEQLERADRSLYVAKRAGRGRIAIWSDEPAGS